jgi:hypothetical protein
MSLSQLFVLAALTATAVAAPLSFNTISTLSNAQISTFTSFSLFASTAYCNPSTTLNWSCGENCQGNPDFQPIASGGDGDDIQFWYVGFDPASNSVIVAHQGTDPEQIESLLTDADVLMGSLDSNLFPGIDPGIQVHQGFADEQAKTATGILNAVTEAMSQHNATAVTLVGHSLGAALSLLDSVFLPLHLPSGTTFQTFGYGLPRVGNPAFADYVDANLHLEHINNQKDFIPIIPAEFLGYRHPSGQVHIREDESWTTCPGQENSNDACTDGDVSNIFEGDLGNHMGPYGSVTMGC